MSRAVSKRVEKEDWTIDSVEYLYLEGVSWELYEHLLKVAASRPLRLTYHRGELEIMSPLSEHENAARVIGRLIEELTMHLGVPAVGLKSTTFRQKLKECGLEPDECYYIQSQSKLRSVKRIKLPKDPPPDLAVEVDNTRACIERLPIYAALGVAEVWRYAGRNLECLVLKNGEYERVQFSHAFPKLKVGDLVKFLQVAEQKIDQNAAISAFRTWLKKQSWARAPKRG
jgi:Uma2 family endonuclease